MQSIPRSLVALFVTTAGALSGLAAQSRIRSAAPVDVSRLAVVPPANVTVTGNFQSATLTWTAAAGAASYRVVRSTDPAVPGTDLTQPISATTYVDAQVAPGQTYYYSVLAVAPTGLTASAPAVAFAVPAQLVKTGRPASRFVQPPAPPSTLPAITSINPTQPYPGQIVTVTGANLTGITGITVSRAGQSAPDAVANLRMVAYPAAGQATFEMPSHPSWLHGQPLDIVVSNGSGAGTAFVTTIDRMAVVTGATIAVVLSGGATPITVQGRNLDRVQAGYIDVTTPNVPPSPKFPATPGPLGLSVTMPVPAGCIRKGLLRFEEAGNGTTQSANFIPGPGAGCGLAPLVTSVVPAAVPPNGIVHVYGQGLTWATIRGTIGLQVQTTLVSDNEMTVKVPATMQTATGSAAARSPLYGAQPLPARLTSPLLPPNQTQIPLSFVVAYPPLVATLNTPAAEPGQSVTITGQGLAAPALQPSVTVGTQPATISSATATSITFVMPAPDPNVPPNDPVPVAVHHVGGTSIAPAQLIPLDGPSAITSIAPAIVPAGVSTVVTVQGANLARARGICLPGVTQASSMLGRIDPVTGNIQLMVTVRTGALSGAISLAVPQSPTQPLALVCQPNPTPVTITIQ